MNIKKKVFVEWYPYEPNKFVLGSSNLKLLQISQKSKSGKEKNFPEHFPDSSLSEYQTNIKTIAVNAEIKDPRCISFAPSQYTDTTQIAVGLNGRVALTSFSERKQNTKEFVSRHSRGCLSIAWNQQLPNYIATGMERVRHDYSAFVWDINSTGQIETDVSSGSESVKYFSSQSMSGLSQVTQASRELNSNEATVALSWSTSCPFLLATGTDSNCLKLTDLRGTFAPPKYVQAHNKTVLGVVFNPFQQDLLATFGEDGVIKIWDIRKLETAVLAIDSKSKQLLQINWCPTRTGILSSIGANESVLKLWDVKADLNMELVSKEYPLKEPVASFNWHPKDEYRVISVNDAGNVQLIRMHEPLPLSFSPSGKISFTIAKSVWDGDLSLRENTDESMHKLQELCLQGKLDISIVIQERAIAGYSASVKKNYEEVVPKFDNPPLLSIWKWIYEMKYFYTRGQTSEFKGIYHLTANSKKEEDTILNPNIPKLSDANKHTVYSSNTRLICSRLCGWGFKDTRELENKIKECLHNGQFTRAASLALFHGNLKHALLLLNDTIKKAPERTSFIVNLQYASMSLSGYQQGGNPLWKSTCESFIPQIEDSYLKAMFMFLCLDTQTDPANEGAKELIYFHNILLQTNMDLFDKIAFACRFLKHSELITFLSLIQEKLVSEGVIEGLLVTGLDETGKGVELLHKYLQKTGDIQTVALLVCQVSKRRIQQPRIEQWIQIYRDLLDRSRLWMERALFDVDRVPNNEVSPQPHAHVACKFCNQSLVLGRDAQARRTGRQVGRGSESSQPEVKKKAIYCPECKKPLPRCSVCLKPFEVTPFDNRNIQMVDTHFWASNNSSFDNWLTFCQTCRHGGHVNHVLEWFEKNTHCPVFDCSCRCESLNNKV